MTIKHSFFCISLFIFGLFCFFLNLKQVEAQCFDQNFQTAPELHVGVFTKGVALADFDGDGKLDISATFQESGLGIAIYRNLGSEQFGQRIDLPEPGFLLESSFTKDLDNDGKPDIIGSNTSGRFIAIYRNLSSSPGNLSFANPIVLEVGGTQARSVAFGDFDGDNKPDIVTANPAGATSNISILRNTSDATASNISFAPRIDIATGAARVVETGDFDSDGKIDILLGSGPSGNLEVFKNTSSGIGNISFEIAFNFNVSTPREVIVGDFDLDNKIDIATIPNLETEVWILRNISSGAGDFSFEQEQKFDVGLAPFDLVAEDFNNDGKLDIATNNTNGNSVSILRNTSNQIGVISFAERDWEFGAGTRPYRLTAGDVNSDGFTDIVTANLVGESVSILFNENSTSNQINFAGRKDYLPPTDSGVSEITADDFDGDGIKDFAVTFRESNNSNFISIFKNNGNGNFFSRTDFEFTTAFVFPYSLTSGDFNNDGKQDIALLGLGKVRFLENIRTNVGEINFQLSNYQIFVQAVVKEVYAIDIDNDGKKDLVVTRTVDLNTDRVLIYRNTTVNGGALSFQESASFESQNDRTKIAFGDFNSDGKTDMAFSNDAVGENDISIKINTGGNGQISFTTQNISETGINFIHVLAADINNDGKEDIVSGDERHLYVFENTTTTGNVTFAPKVTFQNLFLIPEGVGDFANDGKVDIVLRNRREGYLKVFKNNSTNSTIDFALGQQIAIGGNDFQGSNTTVKVSDFNDDGRPDIANGYWSVVGSPRGNISILLSQPNCQESNSAVFDFDGDGKTDIGIWRPAPGEWWFLRSSEGVANAFQFGQTTDKIVPADFTGDGANDVAFWRESSGEWFVLRSEDSSFFSFPFGTSGDIPIPADFDGDGQADPAIFRPSSATWFILNSGGGTTIQQFGLNGDHPIAKDFDGDGKADLAIYRPNVSEWYFQRSSDNVVQGFQFGNSEDKAVPADFTGDGKADIAFWRPASGEWFILRSEDSSFYAFPFGTSGDIPIPGDYDGDGRADAAVFRPSNNTWFLQRSTDGFEAVGFGSTGDIPISSAYNS